MLNAVGQNVFPKSIVCGVVPLFDDDSWKLVNISVCTYICRHNSASSVKGSKLHMQGARYILDTCWVQSIDLGNSWTTLQSVDRQQSIDTCSIQEQPIQFIGCTELKVQV